MSRCSLRENQSSQNGTWNNVRPLETSLYLCSVLPSLQVRLQNVIKLACSCQLCRSACTPLAPARSSSTSGLIWAWGSEKKETCCLRGLFHCGKRSGTGFTPQPQHTWLWIRGKGRKADYVWFNELLLQTPRAPLRRWWCLKVRPWQTLPYCMCDAVGDSHTVACVYLDQRDKKEGGCRWMNRGALLRAKTTKHTKKT